ncbi:MAG: DUF2914 domain-containing protein [Calditrichaceae bacterium]|nr:DUF2914 domain-containing protein [Calditrichaceae bacterium]HES59561.1 DUF2914 domain-containing protein [Caldithrix sp.]
MDSTKIRAKLEDSKLGQRTTLFYKNYKRFLPVASFTAGFTWDSVTLTRIDLWSDNLILLAYITLLGGMLILVNFINDGVISKKWILNYQNWYPMGIQFFLGGLFSSYVVFYFKSAALTKNWLFLGFLIIILIGNEFIENRLTNLKLQFILYFLATFSFFIFFIPVLLKVMNTFVFILSGIISLGWVIGLLYFIINKSGKRTFDEFKKMTIIIISIFFLLNVLYFLNWIPPVPLSLKDAGIYHYVSRIEEGYQVIFEKGPWYHIWKSSDNDFHYHPGDTVYCYAAVFAPTELNKKIIHQWQIFDEQTDEWKTTDRLSYKISGGRDGGYRGYSYKKNMQNGEWRINVITKEGLLLGRISFDVLSGKDKTITFKNIIKQ